jgi:hypothetical protein
MFDKSPGAVNIRSNNVANAVGPPVDAGIIGENTMCTTGREVIPCSVITASTVIFVAASLLIFSVYNGNTAVTGSAQCCIRFCNFTQLQKSIYCLDYFVRNRIFKFILSYRSDKMIVTKGQILKIINRTKNIILIKEVLI